MTSRRSRFSRCVPYVMRAEDKQAFIRALEADVDLRDDVQAVLGKDLDGLTDDEKLVVLRNYEDASFGIAQFAAMARARRDLRREAALARGDLSEGDQLALLQAENEHLKGLLKELSEIVGSTTK